MGASILVVEDEPAIQELVAYTCSSNGYTVRRADSVGAARDAIVQELPDLVLLDWMLPDKPGLELLKNLRTEDRTRALPVIMLTARGGEADRVVGLDRGPTIMSSSRFRRASSCRASARCSVGVRPS